jgi:hypothetical protein
MRFIWFIILLLICSPAQADEIPDAIFHNRLSLEYSYNNLKHYIKRDYIDDITFGINIPGTLKYSYVGVEGAIVGQIEKRAKHIAQRRLRQLIHHGNISEEEIKLETAAIDGPTNFYGNWWDRDWFYSLPEEKGGAPRKISTVYVGKKILVPKDWPVVSFLKKQYDRLGDIWVRNDHIYDEERTKTGAPIGETKEKEKRENDINDFDKIKLRETSILFDANEINQEWFKGKFYHFRFKPSIRIKGGSDPKDFVDEVSTRFVIELFMKKRKHVADLIFFVKYNIPEDEFLASVFLSVLTW